MDARMVTLLRIVGLLILLGLVTAPPSRTAVKKDYNEYKGRRFTSAESTAVATAIAEIGRMAGQQIDPNLAGLMYGMEGCLREMLEKGTLCAEAGTTRNRGYTQPGEPKKDAKWTPCRWADDKINIAPYLITADKSKAKYWELVSVLIHEARHAVQWEILPPPVNPGATPSVEWDPYTWETWAVCQALEENLSTEDSLRLDRVKKLAKWRRDVMCSDTLSGIERSDSFLVCQKRLGTAAGGKLYHNADDNRSQIVLIDGVMEYTIQTPYPYVFDFDVEPDVFGNDILVVCGSNQNGSTGGVAMYYDNTFDGLPDQATEMILGNLAKPTSVDLEPAGGIPGRLFVFDSNADEVYYASLDADGRPVPLNPMPFADAVMFPFLADMYSLLIVESDPVPATEGGSAIQAFEILMSADPAEFDFGYFGSTKYVLNDINMDGIADGFVTVDSTNAFITYQPTIVSDLQAGDANLIALGLANSTLRVHVTDLHATFLGEQLAEHVVGPDESAVGLTIPLNRPLVQGERIVVADVTTGERETKGELVHPVRPEIFTTDLPSYEPGDTIFVIGRNFTPTSFISLSGSPLPTIYVEDTLLTTVAPNLSVTPMNAFLLTVTADADTSRFIGVYIMPDCNNNGIDDIIDIQNGTETDANENSIPDACEVPSVFKPKSTGPVFALGQNFPNPFNPTTTIRYEVEHDGPLELVVYDVTGASVRVLYRGIRKSGMYQAEWDGLNERGQAVASGVYFYRLRTPVQSSTRKMVILR